MAGQSGLRRRPLPRRRRTSAARRSFSAPNSARWRAPISSTRRARRPTPGSTCVIACAFNFDAHSAELERIGRIPILKARMNPDLHMAGELKNTGAGNLFVVFGEPDIAIEPVGRRPDPGQDQGRRCVQAADRRDRVRRPRHDRAAGSSTPTTTRKASSSATPISSAPNRPLQGAEDDPARPRSTRKPGRASTATPPALPETQIRPHRRQSHQPPRRRGDEGVLGAVMARHCAPFETPASRAPQGEDFLNAIKDFPHAEERPIGRVSKHAQRRWGDGFPHRRHLHRQPRPAERRPSRRRSRRRRSICN